MFKIDTHTNEICIFWIQFNTESRYVSPVLYDIDNHDSSYTYARYTPKGLRITNKKLSD
ncbi:hypothetical protein MtrunA17_Chr6g0461691 [Medicago truncatula]|uniref:Uncharacterized protein n=1 Tax=Medicago truncatula TaxID=3880 RepID=A0A396HBW9_MEDTR|nr:hypothetical protein MtrunA17_Chr6g0461691 [Medicago truncatula]